MSSYKLLSIVLGVLVLVAGGFLVFEKWKHKSTRTQLNNQIAKLEGTVKETDTAYSRRGIELEDLRSENSELQQIIEDRDEEILALGSVAFKWKDKYFKVKNAQQTVIPVEVTPTDDGEEVVVAEISPDCAACLAENRIRVDFEHEEEPLKVKGFTLTSPPEAELKLEWTRNLKLDLILTINEDDTFRVYVDPQTSDVGEAELTLNVDPSLFDHKWYEKIGLGFDFNIGENGVISGVRVYYDILDNLYVGPNIVVQINGLSAQVYYGATIGWYPFRW